MTLVEQNVRPPSGDAPPAGVSWWRRNRLPLLVVALLIPALAAGVTGFQWFISYGSAPGGVVAQGAEGEPTMLDGATWGPVRSGWIRDDAGLDVPDGARVFAAIVPVDPDSSGVRCSTPRLVQQSTGREWSPLRAEIGLGFNADEHDMCPSDAADPYELAVAFVLPEEAEGPFWVEIPVGVEGGTLRFPVDP